MAYRRRQGITRATTFKEEIYRQPPDEFNDDVDNDTSSLAAQAIRASAAHRDSSLSSAYADSAFRRDPDRFPSNHKVFDSQESTSMSNNSRNGFWGIMAKKAKEILEVEESSGHFESTGMTRPQMLSNVVGDQIHQERQTNNGFRKTENPRLRKGLNALTTSLNQIGNTFEKAFEEGRTIVENKTADIIQETRKLQIRKKGSNSETQNQMPGPHGLWQQPFPAHPQTNQETQLKASRDVAMATAAKAKLLLRELKNVKAYLAFAKERCSQLEEENKILRESCAKGANPADDDLIRLQLETLLAEKARLAHENSVYARENRFLREIVEYHQLTMQDVVYLDEGIEEVTEVYPISFPGVPGILSASPMSPQSPTSPDAAPVTEQPSGDEQNLPVAELPQKRQENLETEILKNLVSTTPQIERAERHSTSSA